MTRPLIAIIGVLSVFAVQHLPAPDTPTGFYLGFFGGIVLGAVLGAAFVYGERERPQRETRP
jgi:hypothetical protein